jgi:hypothetical protein
MDNDRAKPRSAVAVRRGTPPLGHRASQPEEGTRRLCTKMRLPPSCRGCRGRRRIGRRRIAALCHTRFPEGNQMHLICVPGSNSTHMIDEMSVIS